MSYTPGFSIQINIGKPELSIFSFFFISSSLTNTVANYYSFSVVLVSHGPEAVVCDRYPTVTSAI